MSLPPLLDEDLVDDDLVEEELPPLLVTLGLEVDPDRFTELELLLFGV